LELEGLRRRKRKMPRPTVVTEGGREVRTFHGKDFRQEKPNLE